MTRDQSSFSKNQTQTQTQTQTRKSNHKQKRTHKCALCKKPLINETYSNHYCQSGIEIQANGYIKKLLRKDSQPRNKFPDVQHVWADTHPEKENTYLLKIKAPLDIIPLFLEEIKSHLSSSRSRTRPNSNQRPGSSQRPNSNQSADDKHSPSPSPSPRPHSRPLAIRF